MFILLNGSPLVQSVPEGELKSKGMGFRAASRCNGFSMPILRPHTRRREEQQEGIQVSQPAGPPAIQPCGKVGVSVSSGLSLVALALRPRFLSGEAGRRRRIPTAGGRLVPSAVQRFKQSRQRRQALRKAVC